MRPDLLPLAWVLSSVLVACTPEPGGTDAAPTAPPNPAPPPSASTAAVAPSQATLPPQLPVNVPRERTILKMGPDGETQCFDFHSTLSDMLRVKPAGPVLVALHGRGSSRAAFARLAPDLQRRGIGVVAVDLRSGREHAGVENLSAMHYRRVHGRDAEVSEDAADIPFALARLREYAPHSRLALLGEGPAATQALRYVAESPGAVEALFLFSPEPVEGCDPARDNPRIQVQVYATCGHGAEERQRLLDAVRGIDPRWLTMFVPPDDVAAAPGAATLHVEPESDRDRQRGPLYERMLALRE